MTSGTTVAGTCTYCGAPISRRYPPSHRIPTHMYCNREHMCLSKRRESGKGRRVYPVVYPMLRDREWLAEALSHGSPRQVAAELGCTDDAVRKVAHRLGIAWSRRYTTPTPTQEVEA